MNWYVALAEKNATVERERPADCILPPQTVMERLEAAGCEVFYPKVRIIRMRHCKRTRGQIRETVWQAPFGRYVFAGGRPEVINAVRGVSMLLHDMNGDPGVVPADQIEGLKQIYKDYKHIIKLQTFALKKGQKVRLIDGPFRSYDAEVESIDKLCQGQFRAIVDVLGGKVPVDIPIEHVEAGEFSA